MRNVAPDSPGSDARARRAAPGVKSKPISGSFATTTDHTIQTEKAKSRQAIEIQRLRVAIRRPVLLPEVLVLRVPVLQDRARGIGIGGNPCISGSSGSWSSGTAPRGALHRRIDTCIQVNATPDQQEQEGEARGIDAGQIEQRAEHDRQHEATQAADHPDETADRADMPGVIDRDVLEDRRLAEAHEEAEREDRDHERAKVHLRSRRRSDRSRRGSRSRSADRTASAARSSRSRRSSTSPSARRAGRTRCPP